MRQKFDVTATDIRLGTVEDPCKCPVARSIKRVFKKCNVIVKHNIELVSGGSSRFFKYPKKVDRFIDAFDTGKKVKPFSFTISV